MKRTLALPLAALVLFVALPVPAHNSDDHGHAVEDGFWNVLNGFSTKTGYRYVFTWDADVPIAASVEYSYSPVFTPLKIARPLGDVVDTAGVAIIDVPRAEATPGRDVYYRVRDLTTDDLSPVKTFKAGNAWRSDAADGIYEINAIFQIDSEDLPDGVPFDQGLAEAANAVEILAERIWDASDGYTRIANVLVTDTELNYPLYVPFGGAGCAGTIDAQGYAVQHTLADFIVQTTIPFDSHTFGSNPPVIDSPCTAFYLGRVGQLVVPWEDDLHMGYVMAHEFGHYAFGFADLYPALGGDAQCSAGTSGGPPSNAAGRWDITLMHNTGGWTGNRWTHTELDRGEAYTDCDYGSLNGDHTSGSTDVSWAILSRAAFYSSIPAAGRLGTYLPDHDDSAFDRARGNPNGGALDIYILNHQAGLSQMRHEVKSAPAPLAVSAGGPYTASVNANVPFAGTVSGGTAPYQFLWSFGDGATATTQATTHTYTTAGTFTVSFRATDAGGMTQTATTTATIAPPPSTPPTVSGAAHSGVSSDRATIQWTVTGSDPVKSRVHFGRDGSLSGVTSPVDGTGPQQITLQGLQGGAQYSYRVRVENTGTGAFHESDIQQFTTNAHPTTAPPPTTSAAPPPPPSSGGGPTGNRAPTAYFTYSLNERALRVDASGSSDPDGDALSYQWDFGDGNAGHGRAAQHSYAQQGSFKVTLTVTDGAGLSATSIQSVATAKATGPTALLVVRPQSPAPGVAVEFDASKSQAGESPIQKYEWAFSAEAPLQPGPSIQQRVFPAAGTYEVRLRVIDSAGLSSEKSFPVVVAERATDTQGLSGDAGPLVAADVPAAKEAPGGIALASVAGVLCVAFALRRRRFRPAGAPPAASRAASAP